QKIGQTDKFSSFSLVPQKSYLHNMQKHHKMSDELAKKNLPGQYVSRSVFLAVAEVCVGEPSCDCGMRGLSTNFAFRSGAGSRKHTHTHTQTNTYIHKEKETTHTQQGHGGGQEREE
ncbi:hypothetical protein ATANTOWER_029206, partial [Ataeniobius toweri]|nr:hypothetical protein [Ataeniobius toweri]